MSAVREGCRLPASCPPFFRFTWWVYAVATAGAWKSRFCTVHYLYLMSSLRGWGHIHGPESPYPVSMALLLTTADSPLHSPRMDSMLYIFSLDYQFLSYLATEEQ